LEKLRQQLKEADAKNSIPVPDEIFSTHSKTAFSVASKTK
jgi:hypothetical protein